MEVFEEEALWEKIICDHNPLALQRALFFYAGKTFCLRGSEEQSGLNWEIPPLVYDAYIRDTPLKNNVSKDLLNGSHFSEYWRVLVVPTSLVCDMEERLLVLA